MSDSKSYSVSDEVSDRGVPGGDHTHQPSRSRSSPRADLVNTVPAQILRDLMNAICDDDHKTHNLVLKKLSDKASKNATAPSKEMGQRGTKRKHLPVCKGCGVEFDPTDNAIGSCKYYLCHPSTHIFSTHGVDEYQSQVFVLTKSTHLEVAFQDLDREDVWVDTYGGDPDSFDEVPEGYTFYCCGGDGLSPACSSYKHVAEADARDVSRVRM